MQCRVPLLHSLFLAGNVVTFDLWFGIFSPSPDLSGSQGITTRCSENGAVTDTSFKIPSNGLQSFLYRHQYGEHDLVCHSVVFVQMNPLKIFRNHIHPYSCFLSFLCRVWSIMERVTVWTFHQSFTGFRRLESDLLKSSPSTFLPSGNSCSWCVCTFVVSYSEILKGGGY